MLLECVNQNWTDFTLFLFTNLQEQIVFFDKMSCACPTMNVNFVISFFFLTTVYMYMTCAIMQKGKRL